MLESGAGHLRIVEAIDDRAPVGLGERAARLPLNAVEEQRWEQVVQYAGTRAADPTPSRAAQLRGELRAIESGLLALFADRGYEEVATAFRDWEHFSSARTDPEISSIVLGDSRLPLLTPEEIDPPDWYPVRRILSELLAPRADHGRHDRVEKRAEFVQISARR